jgi:phosphoserine phosphatase
MGELKKIIVADICNTLFDSNTTFDFVRYCVYSRRLRFNRSLYNAIFSKNSPLFIAIALLQKFSRKDLHKKIAVSLFKNRSPEEVRRWASSFLKEYLQGREIDESLACLQEYRPEDIILVSSTIYPVAEIIADYLKINQFIATELEVVDFKYTGKIKQEISGAKLSALSKKFDTKDFEIEMVITDNFSDKELMNKSKKKMAVCYDGRQEKFWRNLSDVNIIRVKNIPRNG